MLHWVGQKPLDVVRHFPAQLCETVGVKRPPAEPSYKEFVKANYNLLFHGDNKEILSSLLIAGFRGKIDLQFWGHNTELFSNSLRARFTWTKRLSA